MLMLRPSCECCDRDLPPQATNARICSFECTFCDECAIGVLGGVCPNCGGELLARPRRPAERLARFPASSERVFKPDGCARAAAARAAGAEPPTAPKSPSGPSSDAGPTMRIGPFAEPDEPAPWGRGGGYGHALMAQVERLLRGRGCPKINLLVRSGNQAVIDFYRRLGYAADEALCLGKRLIPNDPPRDPHRAANRQG